MYSVQKSKTKLNTPLRLAMAFAVMFTLGLWVIFFILHQHLDSLLDDQIDEQLRDQQSAMILQQMEHGMAGVYAMINHHISREGDEQVAYRVRDQNGKVLFEAGHMRMPPLVVSPKIHEVTLLPASPGEPDQVARVLSFELPGKIVVFIAKGGHQIDELKEHFWHVFIRSELLIALLGAAMGLWLANRFRLAIEKFNTLTKQIVQAGDLSRRMPVVGQDEFSELAANMNAMLDRIERLVQGIRQVGDNIAHDLRTPLTRVRAGVEMALRSEKDVEAWQSSLERVKGEVDSMQRIIVSLLALGQAEASRTALKTELLDVSGMLLEMVELFEPSAENSGLQLSSEIAEGLVVEGDRQLLAQVFSNLLDNAIKYVPHGGKVALTAVPRGNWVEISIEDSGPGIPPEMREKIFERFIRLDPSRTMPGSGLGLALVKAFVELHEGSVSVSESRFGGAAFTIKLPVHSPYCKLERA
jgi:signal transduction histidine kinase